MRPTTLTDNAGAINVTNVLNTGVATFTIVADPGYYLKQLTFGESGAFMVWHRGTATSSASVLGTLDIYRTGVAVPLTTLAVGTGPLQNPLAGSAGACPVTPTTPATVQCTNSFTWGPGKFVNVPVVTAVLPGYRDSLTIKLDDVLNARRSTTRAIGAQVTLTTVDIGIMAAVVPEPETYALMLAGLGVIGFLARRRRNS